MNKAERRQRAIERRRQDVKAYRKLLDSEWGKDEKKKVNGTELGKASVERKLKIAEAEVEKSGVEND